MHFVQVGARRYAQFERLRLEPGLVHAFSTRPQDMSPRSDPADWRRAEHRVAMTRDWGLDPRALHICLQVHGKNIAWVDRDRPGGRLPNCDGVVTSLPGVALMAFSADCPLVLVYDRRRRAVGLVHASWRCTAAQVVGHAIEMMISRLSCRPADMVAGIGPGAGPCCYEVRADVYEATAALPGRERLFARRDERMYFDLWEANRAQLRAAGLADHQVELAGLCTMCRNDIFFSYRREGAGCGHFCLLAGIRHGEAAGNAQSAGSSIVAPHG